MGVNYHRQDWLSQRQSFFRRQQRWERMPLHKQIQIESRREQLKPGELRKINELASGVKLKIFTIQGKYLLEFCVGTPDETRLPKSLADYDYTEFKHSLSTVTFGSKSQKIALCCGLDYLSRLLDWAYWGDLIALEIHGGNPGKLWDLVESQINSGQFNYGGSIAKLARELPKGNMADPTYRHDQTNYDYLWTSGKLSNSEAYKAASCLFSSYPTISE